jgi:hypothetical protein
MVEFVWSKFEDRYVLSVDGTLLTYYSDYNVQHDTTAALLANGDGQCDAWCKLFLDVLRIQGKETGSLLWLAPKNSMKLIVKEWSIPTKGGLSGNNDYCYLNVYGLPTVVGAKYNFWFEQAHDRRGIPGQGMSNPASLFEGHYVVQLKHNGKYYDPSYGNTYTNNADFLSQSISGFCMNERVQVSEAVVDTDGNGDGDKNDVFPSESVLQICDPTGDTIIDDIEDY